MLVEALFKRPRGRRPRALGGVFDSFEGYVAQSAEALLMFIIEGEPEASIGWFCVGVTTYSWWSECHLPQIELQVGNPSENLCPVRGGQL